MERRQRRSFTDDYKRQAVDLVASSGGPGHDRQPPVSPSLNRALPKSPCSHFFSHEVTLLSQTSEVARHFGQSVKFTVTVFNREKPSSIELSDISLPTPLCLNPP
jgi:transposase-like protein